MCPPRMSDGRAFTDYKPRCGVYESLTKLSQSASSQQPMNSYELRQYMIANAESIMQQNRTYVEQMNACGPCKQPYNVGTMLPEQSMVKCNTSTCSVSTNDPYGLGQGRDYGAPTDTDFLKRMEQRDAQMRTNPTNCCTGYEEDLRYYSIAGAPVTEERYSVPSGGSPF